MAEAETDLFGGGGSGGPSAKFAEKGKWVSGTILRVEKVPEIDYVTKEQKLWPSGDPKELTVVTIQTEERDPEVQDDDGVRAIYCKWQIEKAVWDAIRESGHQGRMVGGQLAVCWSDEQPAKTKGFNPMKLYKAKFSPPAETDAFIGEPPDPMTDPF